MDWTWYLFRFEGRINRAKLWLAMLVILCWMMFLAGLAFVTGIVSRGASFGFSLDDLFRVVHPATYRSWSWAGLPFLLVKVSGTSLFLWVYFATSIKRLHDRDKSGWWMVPFIALPGLFNQFADRLPDSYADLPLAMAAFALCLWGFIEMYCLKGSRKTNRFRRRPAGTAAAARYAATLDQQSEIEMVPHKAGPPPVWRVKREA